LLTIFYLYKVLCSSGIFNPNRCDVVNCLQFFIFTRFFAVFFFQIVLLLPLWIAYNFLSLQGSLQSIIATILIRTSCELLTIFYLYKVLCSMKSWFLHKPQVVNCLQFFIFTRFFAVKQVITIIGFLLWIAYNFLSLQGSLQFFVFWVPSIDRLWIAYNFLSLQGSLQFQKPILLNILGCELLTIFYLYKVLCSVVGIQSLMTDVVNCLQFFIFTRFFAVIKS